MTVRHNRFLRKKNSGQKETNKQTGRFSLDVTGRHRETKHLEFIMYNIAAGTAGTSIPVATLTLLAVRYWHNVTASTKYIIKKVRKFVFGSSQMTFCNQSLPKDSTSVR